MSLNRATMIAAVVLAAAALALSCGGGSPSSSTPPTTAPTPATSPTPSGSGGGAGTCAVLNGDPNAACEKGSWKLANDVMAAMDRLIEKKPQLFDLKDETAPIGFGNYRVVDRDGYLDGLIAELLSAGFCAQRDPDDYNYQQIQVKDSSDFSENYDVLSAAGYVWHNTYSYRATCTPASFPIDRSDLPPAGSGCGKPYPPPISKFNSKDYLPGPEYDLLDSTPIVGPDPAYCLAIGYTDGRASGPVRLPQSPERIPCETWRVGYAKDTGRPGPTWTLNGHYCTGKESGCENFEYNQYNLKAYVGGTYVMCGQNGACGSVTIGR